MEAAPNDGLYYRDGQRWYWVPLTGLQDQPFAEPELYVEGDFLNVPGSEYAVHPDGQRLLLLKGPGEPATRTLNVVTNWIQQLEQRFESSGN